MVTVSFASVNCFLWHYYSFSATLYSSSIARGDGTASTASCHTVVA